MFKPQRDDEQGQTQRKGHQRLGAGKIGITCQLADNPRSDGCHRLERVAREFGDRSGGHHNNHRFTNGARLRPTRIAPTIPGSAAGKITLPHGFRMRRTQTQRAVAHGLWYRVDNVVRQ